MRRHRMRSITNEHNTATLPRPEQGLIGQRDRFSPHASDQQYQQVVAGGQHRCSMFSRTRRRLDHGDEIETAIRRGICTIWPPRPSQTVVALPPRGTTFGRIELRHRAGDVAGRGHQLRYAAEPVLTITADEPVSICCHIFFKAELILSSAGFRAVRRVSLTSTRPVAIAASIRISARSARAMLQ